MIVNKDEEFRKIIKDAKKNNPSFHKQSEEFYLNLLRAAIADLGKEEILQSLDAYNEAEKFSVPYLRAIFLNKKDEITKQTNRERKVILGGVPKNFK